MSDSSDNSIMDEDEDCKEPKRLKDIAMTKLFHMLIECFIPHILRSYQDIDPEGFFGANGEEPLEGFECFLDAIREKALAVRDWLYEPLSCSVANDVQELVIKVLPQLRHVGLLHPALEYVQLLVLHPKCHNLSSTFFSNYMMEDVIDMLQSLISLERIEWTVPPLPEEQTDKFTTNLKYCTRLKVFVHKLGCNDEMIKVLSQNCPLLSVLDVENSKRVTNVSAHYIGNMKSLRTCNIKDTSITLEGIVIILKNCPQLCQLDTYYDICDILEDFEIFEDPIELSLRTAELYTPYYITPRLLKKYCPFLTHVRISELGSEPPCHLISVERLTILDLSCRYSALDTWLILENINVITLSRIEMSDRDLVQLSNGCQNITELYVTVYHGISSTHSFLEHRPFQKLKILTFKIVGIEARFRETDVSIFKILLSYSTMITHVDIKNLRIDDRTVETIFKTNEMRYLQYWRMEKLNVLRKHFFCCLICAPC